MPRSWTLRSPSCERPSGCTRSSPAWPWPGLARTRSSGGRATWPGTRSGLARLGRARQGESPERAAPRSVLAALAGSAYADPADLEARIVALGVPLAGRVLIPVVIRVAGGENTPGDMASALATACRDLRPPPIAGTLGDRRAGALRALSARA